MKITGFDQLIIDVRQFEQDLTAPRGFYQKQAPTYHEEARRIAIEVLTFLRPADRNAESWRLKVEKVAARIALDLHLFGDGFMLSFLSPAEANPASGNQSASFSAIRDWVVAGLDGEPEPAKRITPDDMKIIAELGRTAGINAIAATVMKAYYSTQPLAAYGRLRAAIQRYLAGTGTETQDVYLDAVAAAWAEQFSTRVHHDLSAHATALCRQF